MAAAAAAAAAAAIHTNDNNIKYIERSVNNVAAGDENVEDFQTRPQQLDGCGGRALRTSRWYVFLRFLHTTHNTVKSDLTS